MRLDLPIVTTDGYGGLGLLGGPGRRDIFELLAGRPCSVQELVDELPISRPAVSQYPRVLSPEHANAIGVATYADRSPEQLINLARTYLQPRGLAAKFGGRIALTDGMIHHQDIRRPLGVLRQIPAPRLIAALDFATTARPIGAAQRIHGLKLTATDLGDGLEITGTAESLLMALAGRRGITPELTGHGVAILAERINR